MKVVQNLKEKVTEAAETAYRASKKDMDLALTKKGLKVKEKRPTQQRIKWQSKNH